MAHQAERYQRLMASVDAHLQGRALVAGPDCPEVYFLAGQINPTGTMYEFMSYGSSKTQDSGAVDDWLRGGVIVVNHEPDFSMPLDALLVARLRDAFPSGERIDNFEVRWR
jgi:hypothetical protein